MAFLSFRVLSNILKFVLGMLSFNRGFPASHNLKTEWIVLKSISQYADCNDGSDDWLAFANGMAASVVSNILSEPYVFEELPHYNDTRSKTSKGTIMKEWSEKEWYYRVKYKGSTMEPRF